MYAARGLRRIQEQIDRNDEELFAGEPADLATLRSFAYGRYRTFTHRAIMRQILRNPDLDPVLDVGCKNAQIGLELLGLDSRRSYVGIELSEDESDIADRRLQAASWCQGRYEVLRGDVFEVLKEAEMPAGILLTTWAPMIELRRFIEECLPQVQGWHMWLLEFQLESYRRRCERKGTKFKSGYQTYSVEKVYQMVAGVGTPRMLWGSRLSRVSRVVGVRRS